MVLDLFYLLTISMTVLAVVVMVLVFEIIFYIALEDRIMNFVFLFSMAPTILNVYKMPAMSEKFHERNI